jgi:hypothetical protein
MQIGRFTAVGPQVCTETRRGRWFASATIAMALAATMAGCGGGGSGDPAAPTPATQGMAVIGATGGTVTGEDGATVVVPPGALKEPAGVTIAIAKSAVGAPIEQPSASFLPVSNTFTITPHGHGFAQPVKVTLPFDASLVRDDDQLVILKAQPFGRWVAHTEVTRSGATASVEVREFSTFMVAIRPPIRITPAPNTPAPTPFSFSVTVSGTTPNLTLTYTFSGTRPTCIEGDKLETVFIAEYDYSYHDPLVGFPQHSINRTDLLVVTVPGFSSLSGNTVTHVVIQPPHSPGGDQPGNGALYVTPFVEGRYTCTSERLANNEVAAPWTMPSANRPQLPWNGSNIALLQDIGDVATSMGAPVVSRARAQAPAASPLAAQSKWEISRDGGTTWSLYKLGAERIAADTTFYASATDAQTAGLWALEADLPPFAGTDNGALLRFTACSLIYGFYYSSDPPMLRCVAGAAHPVSVAFAAQAPTFTVMPTPMAVIAGAGASFSAVATGLPAPTLQWQRRLPNGTWEDIVGATSATYNLATTNGGHDGTQFRLVATNASGSATSALATLNVLDQAAPPAVTAVSGSMTVVRGGTAVFAATVKGTEPLSYQWRRNGVDVLGANTPILRLDNVADGQGGDYVLHVSNPAGAVQTAAQALSVVADGSGLVTAPTIVTQPVGVRVHAGNTATLAVGAGGSGPLGYQWKRDGVDIPGATAAFYSIAAATTGDAATYSVVVSNSAGSVTSGNAVLTVDALPLPQAPVITAQPGTVVVVPGMSAMLGIGVQGSGPMSFQWSKDGTPVPGQTQATFAIAAATALDAGTYQVRVSNSAGEATSATAQVIPLGAPAITAQPINKSVTEGATATFSVTASGDFVRYQWSRNAVAIPGATGASYTTPALALADNGAVYAVVVYNGTGVAISSGAVLTVTSVPVAKAWQAATLIETDNAGAADSVQVAVSANGQAIAVWQQSDGTTINIYANRYTPTGGWGTPQRISPVVLETSQAAQVAIDSDGNAIAVWVMSNFLQGSSSADIWASRYTPASGWLPAVKIENGSGDAGSPQIAMDGLGNAFVVFMQQESGRVNVVANRYLKGDGWSTAVPIESDDSGDASAPQIAIDAAGNAMVVWAWASASGPPFSYNVWANRFTAGSGWGSAGPIDADNATTANPAPHVAVDGAGNAMAVWHRPDGGWDSIWSNRYAAGSGWGTPVLVETDNTNSARDARVALDANGNAMAVWIQSDGVRNNAMANRWTSGTGWGTAVLIETDNAGPALEARIAIDPSGNATAVWSHRNIAGFTYDIYANRWTAAGGWATAQKIDSAADPARAPQLGVDGSGNVVATWFQSDGTRNNIWAAGFR